jgi:predicted nucleotide-binding protein
MLEGLIGRLEEKRADLPTDPATRGSGPGASGAAQFDTHAVFLVHGHDEAAKHTVARFLEQLQLVAIILSERPNEGRTVIEKFERNSDVGFAVVLMTPDDIGYQQGMEDQPHPRARQNVLLELGYFIGKLTRTRVAVLYKGSVELPSDYHGVLYIQMDDGDGWKLRLAKELRQAGMEVDLNDAM